MMDLKKKWMYRCGMIALVASLFFSHIRVFAADDIVVQEFALSNFSDTLFPKISEVATLKDIVSSYCAVVMQSPSFIKNDFIYIPQQSAFLHLLCSNAGNSSSNFFETHPYLSRTRFSQIGFQTIVSDGDDTIEYCQSMNNECDLSQNLPDLFNAIISDYVNMKQSNIYGMNDNFTTESDINAQINSFSSGYFDGVQLCSDGARSYPKTCGMMKSYIKNARNLLSDVRIFSTTGILATSNPICDRSNKNYNLMYCGLFGDSSTSFLPFVNLSYNELFYYRLFLGYYFAALQKNPGILVNTSHNNNLSTIMNTFSSQYIRSKDALSLTFRMLRDTNMGFPLHIGFSMYQEDLDGFGKIMARIAPPIYTLYDKLRNVQKPQ